MPNRPTFFTMAGIAIILFSFMSLAHASDESPAHCAQGMAYIPSGEFLKGWDNGEPDERPEVVKFTPSYCIDQYEYPNTKNEMPLVDVTFEKASKLCAAQGKRVCGELEWERACRGPRGTIYTNTQDYKQIKCNLNSPAAQASGANLECTNGYGVFDMTGNVWEWVDGLYSEENPWPLIKGGSFKKGALFSSCYARFTQPPDAESDGVGFRCCAEPLHKSFSVFANRCDYSDRSFIQDDILALKQNTKIASIVYIDPRNNPIEKAPEGTVDHGRSPRALVLRNDGKAFLIEDMELLKDSWEQHPADAKAAQAILTQFMDWTNENSSLLNDSIFWNFWTCSGTHIYIFNNEKEYWLNPTQDTIEAPDPELMLIVNQALELKAGK